jgi:predicted Zn-dependent peptidase
VAGAGRIKHGNFVEMVARYLDKLPSRKGDLQKSSPSSKVKRKVVNKELEQAHLLMGAPCPSMISDDRYTTHVLNVMLGGGMSSRLFQTIREEHGLAYSVYSGVNAYTDAGYLSVYAATSPEQIVEVIKLTLQEFAKMKDGEISEAELERAKGQLKVSIMLGLESTSSRMSNLARQEIFFNRQSTLDEILERIEAVSVEGVRRIAREVFHGDKIAVTALGSLSGLDLDKIDLAC